MKTILKITRILVVIVLLAGAGGYLYLNFAFPKVSPAENIKLITHPKDWSGAST